MPWPAGGGRTISFLPAGRALCPLMLGSTGVGGTIFSLLTEPRVMSALPPKADIAGAKFDVRFVHKQTLAAPTYSLI
jgi:hypothetical protein